MNILDAYRHRSFEEEAKRFRRQLHTAVSESRERLIARYAEMAPQRIALIRRAVDEAETQAWETAFPHLLFPDFAEERLASVVEPSEAPARFKV